MIRCSSTSRKQSLTTTDGNVSMVFDPKTFFIAQSICHVTSQDRDGLERQGNGFLAVIRSPLKINRYGFIVNSSTFVDANGRCFDDAGVQPTVSLQCHFEAHTHPTKIQLLVKRDILKWFVSRNLDIVFLEIEQNMEFLRKQSYNFLQISSEIPIIDQRLLIFRHQEKGKTSRSAYGKIVNVLDEDGMIEWDHSVPNLVPGTPLINADTFKVVAIHQSDSRRPESLYEHAVSLKSFVDEMKASGYLNGGSESNGASKALERKGRTARSHSVVSTVGSLMGHLKHHRNNSSSALSSIKELNLNLIQESDVVPSHLKDPICNILISNFFNF